MTRSSPQTGPKADRRHTLACRFIAIYMAPLGRKPLHRCAGIGPATMVRRGCQADLRRWADGRGREVRWYKDSWTGSDPSRPEWDRLVEDITKGLVETVVCWRLDRLGKTCSELVKLFEYLSARSVNFISLKDHLDLSTVSGRRIAGGGVLGSITLYETEVRVPVPPGRSGGRPGARHPVGRVGEGSAGQGRSRTGGEGRSPPRSRGGRSATSCARRT